MSPQRLVLTSKGRSGALPLPCYTSDQMAQGALPPSGMPRQIQICWQKYTLVKKATLMF